MKKRKKLMLLLGVVLLGILLGDSYLLLATPKERFAATEYRQKTAVQNSAIAELDKEIAAFKADYGEQGLNFLNEETKRLQNELLLLNGRLAIVEKYEMSLATLEERGQAALVTDDLQNLIAIYNEMIVARELPQQPLYQ